MRVRVSIFYPAIANADTAYSGQPKTRSSTGGAAIYYDPDSADDIDEDDPDEDLDI